VCGYPSLEEAPRTQGAGGSYEICPSCGFQFGVTDEDKGVSYEEWRRRWILQGCPWNGVGTKSPLDWNPRAQMKRAGLEVEDTT
jgi:hypothetical protein